MTVSVSERRKDSARSQSRGEEIPLETLSMPVLSERLRQTGARLAVSVDALLDATHASGESAEDAGVKVSRRTGRVRMQGELLSVEQWTVRQTEKRNPYRCIQINRLRDGRTLCVLADEVIITDGMVCERQGERVFPERWRRKVSQIIRSLEMLERECRSENSVSMPAPEPQPRFLRLASLGMFGRVRG